MITVSYYGNEQVSKKSTRELKNLKEQKGR